MKRIKNNGQIVALTNELKNVQNKLYSNSISLSRIQAFQGTTHQGRRDLYGVFGYEKDLCIEHYIAKYERGDIAARVVDAFPEATWSTAPEILEDENSETQTQFEKEWVAFEKRIKVFHYLNRLDILQGLGRYGVLYIGASDVSTIEELKDPLERVSGIDDIKFLMPFSEGCVDISKFETNPLSERFGLPVMYTLRTGEGLSDRHGSSASMPQVSLQVHHSRVIHAAEGNLENDVYGKPKMKKVFNRLEDLEKVVGGSAETFWLNSRGGNNFNLDKEASLSSDELSAIKQQAEEYTHQLARNVYTKGIDVKTMQTTVSSPKDQVSVILDLISGATGIPKRILIGSERGELSSAQDENNWLNRVSERQKNFAEPSILRPFIDRLIEINALPRVDEYFIKWPDTETQSPKDKAEIALKKAQAISTYSGITGQPQFIVPEKQFVEEVLGLEYMGEDIGFSQIEENDPPDEI